MACDASIEAQCEAAPIVILVVEDSIVLRMSVAHYLRSTGYRVVESSNAADALSVLASGIHVDLVFTDIQMPGDMNGIQLAAKLAHEQPSLPVILTSGDHTVNPAGPGGAPRLFVRKPYELEALALHVLEFLGKACPS